MALNIKDPETERLAAEVAEMTGDSKTGAVREALRERRQRLIIRKESPRRDAESLRRFMETEIWSQIPEEKLGQPPLTKQEIEDILGYGPGGV